MQFSCKRSSKCPVFCCYSLGIHTNEVSPLQEGNNALALAILYGHLKIVRILILEGLKVNETYVSSFVVFHCIVTAILLLQTNGATPLHFASSKGHVSIAKYLISRGANIEARNWMNVRLVDFHQTFAYTICDRAELRFLMPSITISVKWCGFL